MKRKQSILLTQWVVQGKGNIVSEMDGEKVMMNIQNGKYYNLSKVGSKIWDMMKEPISVAQLVNALMSSYAVGQTECEEQVRSFLEHLFEENIIEIGETVHS